MIRRVKINNFRSIWEAEVVLPKFSAIMGKNGSGKTNFISAISLFKNLATGMDLETAINKIAPLSSEFFFSKDRSTEATFEFVIDSAKGQKYLFSYKIVYRSIIGNLRFAIDSEILKKITESEETVIYRREKEIAYDGKLGPIPLKIEPNKLMLGAYSNDDVQEAVQTITAYTIIDTSTEAKEGLTIIDANKPGTNTIDGVAVSLFTKDTELFNSAIKCVQKIIPHFLSSDVVKLPNESTTNSSTPKKSDEDLRRFFVTWTEKTPPTRFSHISLSNGDRRVIHLIFSLFNATSSSFLIAEEIENGMHFERLAKLIDHFRTQAHNRKIQVLLTTHSNEILKKLTVDEVIYCKKEQVTGTKLKLIRDTAEYESIKNELQGDHSVADVMDSGLFD